VHLSSAKPRRNSSLEMRVGNITATRIKQALTNTPYEWMLDLSAEEWPAGVSNPCAMKDACRFTDDEDTGALVSA